MKKVLAFLLVGSAIPGLAGCAAGNVPAPTVNVDMQNETESIAEVPLETESASQNSSVDKSDAQHSVNDWVADRPERTNDITVGEVFAGMIARLESSECFTMTETLTMEENGEVWATSGSVLSCNNKTGELYSLSTSQFEGTDITHKMYMVKQPRDGFKYATYSETITTEDGKTQTIAEAVHGRSPIAYYPIYELLTMETCLDIYQDDYMLNNVPHFVLKNIIPVIGQEEVSVTMYINAEDYSITQIVMEDSEASRSEILFNYSHVDISIPKEYADMEFTSLYGDSSEPSQTEIDYIKEHFDSFTSFFEMTDETNIGVEDIVFNADNVQYHLGDSWKDISGTTMDGHYFSEGVLLDTVTGNVLDYQSDIDINRNQVVRFDIFNSSDNSYEGSLWLHNAADKAVDINECVLGAISYDRYYEYDEDFSVSMLSIFDMRAYFGDRYEKTLLSEDRVLCHWSNDDYQVFAEDLGFMWDAMFIQSNSFPDMSVVFKTGINQNSD